VIEAVGEDVQGWSVGDAVLYHGVPCSDRNFMFSFSPLTGSLYRCSGGFAEYAIQDCRYPPFVASHLLRVTRLFIRTLLAHPRVSPVDAAATPCAGVCALLRCLRRM
jgi:NADPH2:quinone reductase